MAAERRGFKAPQLGEQIYQPQGGDISNVPVKNTFIDFPCPNMSSPMNFRVPSQTTPAWLAPSITLASPRRTITAQPPVVKPVNPAQILPMNNIATIKLTEAVPSHDQRLKVANPVTYSQIAPPTYFPNFKKGLLGDPPGSPVYKQNLSAMPSGMMGTGRYYAQQVRNRSTKHSINSVMEEACEYPRTSASYQPQEMYSVQQMPFPMQQADFSTSMYNSHDLMASGMMQQHQLQQQQQQQQQHQHHQAFPHPPVGHGMEMWTQFENSQNVFNGGGY